MRLILVALVVAFSVHTTRDAMAAVVSSDEELSATSISNSIALAFPAPGGHGSVAVSLPANLSKPTIKAVATLGSAVGALLMNPNSLNNIPGLTVTGVTTGTSAEMFIVDGNMNVEGPYPMVTHIDQVTIDPEKFLVGFIHEVDQLTGSGSESGSSNPSFSASMGLITINQIDFTGTKIAIHFNASPADATAFFQSPAVMAAIGIQPNLANATTGNLQPALAGAASKISVTPHN